MSNWIIVATEGTSFNASGVVRYGFGTSWVSATLNGTVSCSGSTFGGVDPAPGMVKQCQVQVSAPNVVQTGGMPVINTALMQPPLPGATTTRIAPISGTGGPGGQDTGAFRTICNFSHFAFDDPIVYPNQPGKSHLHIFFGNGGANASSTADSLANTGDSTCAGGIANRTAYWAPALINLANGAPIVPLQQIWYYKAGYLGVASASVQPFPAGLRMVAGSSGNTTPITSTNVVRISCSTNGAFQPGIPDCPVGQTIDFTVIFPQCWDGMNLDSPDHKSHMAYATGSGCPADHPVPLPEITINITYLVTDPRPDLNWKLSSDNYTGTGGYSMHADWFGAWQPDILAAFVHNCINPAKSVTDDLCDGRMLY